MSAGSRLGPYEILAPLGAGGMGEVYRAHDSRLRRDVAVKLLSGASSDRDALDRLIREARTVAGLSHPHICTVHDVGEAGGVAYMAMELVAGETLHHAIRRDRLTATRACRIGRQLAEALEHAHVHGVIQRDLKSANVMLLPDGRIKVLDFGIAVRTAAAEVPATKGTTQTLPARRAGPSRRSRVRARHRLDRKRRGRG